MRNKKVLAVALVSLFPVAGMAAGENNVGSCGWGSKLFDGQRGVVPQVLAATTNGTFGSQTFGISSGTSGCTQDGVVRSNWKLSMFIDGNKEKLARDMSVGGRRSARLAGRAHRRPSRRQDGILHDDQSELRPHLRVGARLDR